MDCTRAMNCWDALEVPPPRGVGDTDSSSGINHVAVAAAPADAVGDGDEGASGAVVEMRCWTDVLTLVGVGVEDVLVRCDADGADAVISYGGGIVVSSSCSMIPAANSLCAPMLTD